MTETWHQRLNQALTARGKIAADLVRITGLKASSVSDWLSGDTKMMEAGNAAKVCAYLRINLDWLFEGRLPSGLEEDVDMNEEFPGVAVVGNVRGGEGDNARYVELEHAVGQGEGFVRYPMRDPNTYALRVKGDSMRPRIKPGEFIVVEPNHSVMVGEEVMVKTADGRNMVKILSRRSGGDLEFRSINEVDHPPFTLDESQVKDMHYIGAIVKPSWYYERT